MNPSDYLPVISLVSGLFLTVVGTVGSLAWWLSKQFTLIRHLVYDRIDKTEQVLIGKLEYHERHDDSRFAQISNDLWALRIRNAAVDGKVIEDREGALKREARPNNGK